MSPSEAIVRLRELKVILEDPSAFYAAHIQLWTVHARSIATTTLQRLRPDNVEQEAWNGTVSRAVDSIASYLLRADFVGFIVSMSREEAGDAPARTKPGRAGAVEPYTTHVPFQTLVDWVASGREGEDGGKIFKPMDDGRSDAQIAWRLFHAIRLNKNPRLLDAVNAWVALSGLGNVGDAFDAVLTAWVEFFSIQAAADFKEWCEKLVSIANA